MLNNEDTDDEEILKIAKLINKLSCVCDEHPIDLLNDLSGLAYDMEIRDRVRILIKTFKGVY